MQEFNRTFNKNNKQVINCECEEYEDHGIEGGAIGKGCTCDIRESDLTVKLTGVERFLFTNKGANIRVVERTKRQL